MTIFLPLLYFIIHLFLPPFISLLEHKGAVLRTYIEMGGWVTLLMHENIS
jgi:hypothetical protein